MDSQNGKSKEAAAHSETLLTLFFVVLVLTGLWQIKTLSEGGRLLSSLLVGLVSVYVVWGQRLRQAANREIDMYRHWLVALHATSGRISSRMELGETLRAITEGIPDMIPHDECMILLLEPRRNLLTLKSIPKPNAMPHPSKFRNLNPRTSFSLGELKIAADHGLFGQITASKQTVVLPDMSREGQELGILSGYRSFLGTPLVSENELLGVLVLLDEQANRFNTDHTHILNVIAAQSATAIKNAQLYRVSQQMAFTDGLTTVFNRRFFEDQLQLELARGRRYNHTTSLLILDVDFFKRFNDTYGHPLGDEVLRMVGRTLTASTRETDIVARYGGEEFVIILPETDENTAQDVAERIRKNVMAQRIPGPQNEELSVSVSIGVAADSGKGEDHQGLIAAADACLYQAKQRGRNQVVTRNTGILGAAGSLADASQLNASQTVDAG